jgi:hypothetical protein
MPPSAPFGQSRAAARITSSLPSDAGRRRAAIMHTLIETAKLNDVEGVLSDSLRARRPKTIMAAGSLFEHFARQVARAPSRADGRRAQANLPRGRVARRSFTPLGAEVMNSGPDSQAFVKRSALQPSLPERGGRLVYLVLFAPASTEQFPWSLGCEFSQVVIDCVSEADILLLMQSQ